MNTTPYNSQIYNATPTISSANGISVLDFGVFLTSMGLPIEAKFEATNYIVQTSSNTNYIKPVFSNTNYIKS